MTVKQHCKGRWGQVILNNYSNVTVRYPLICSSFIKYYVAFDCTFFKKLVKQDFIYIDNLIICFFLKLWVYDEVKPIESLQNLIFD